MSKVLTASEKRITCPYGPYNTNNPSLKGKIHKGVDIGYSKNEEENKVYANSLGIVYEIQEGLDRNINALGSETWGNFVLIKHPNGMYTRYAHLKKGTIQVKPKQKVDSNTYLGIMGESGLTYGRHLHFEVSTGYNSKFRINPTKYLTESVYEENTIEETTKNNEEFKIGDKVLILKGRATSTSDGSGKVTKEYNGDTNDLGNIKYITIIKEKAKRPYHVSNDKENKQPRGWVTKEQIKKL